MHNNIGPSRRLRGALAIATALAVLAAGCGGKKVGAPARSGKELLKADEVESGLAKAGKPKRGGTLVYGIEAESSGGYCLPEAQLAISGIQVARAIYDPLVTTNNDGKVVPVLAKSVTHSADYKTWTIQVRPGITFHDGSKLDGRVVLNNLKATKGTYPTRKPLLAVFVWQDVADIQQTGPMTVEVKTKKPWVAFSNYLGGGRFGIMAQAQLDDTKTCDRKPIGTGPFQFVSWKQNEVLKVKRNPHYWQIAPDGKPYPYLDGIDFRPIPEGQVRLNALKTGEIDVMHTFDTKMMAKDLKPLRDKGQINMFVSDKNAEVIYLMLNASRAPFNRYEARLAAAIGANRQEINDIAYDGTATLTDGPFAPGTPGYLKDPGYPKYDLERAKKLVADLKKKYPKESSDWTLTLPSDPATIQVGELIQERAKKVGTTVRLNPTEQAKLINDAIGGKYQAVTFRNHGGAEPDAQYVWWHSGSPVNFGRINDPIIDKLLEQGRGEPDPAKRNKIYQDLNREFAKKLWNTWSWYTVWSIAMQGNVHGVVGPDLPDGGGKASTELFAGQSLLNMWKS
ncbi:MAG: ABC-type dipeptide transport system, periplasmic component [Acidimicrobiales bacterium]|nr:ABC-type dipeptide transport system, periplasmic component [Acidimicrobiales bacterium]